MDIRDTEEVFRSELDTIQDQSKRQFVLQVLASLPDYFYEKGSSSTGKYHSPLTNGLHGLAYHVKMAAACANEICDLEYWGFDEVQKDNLRAAVILHDGLKYGDGTTDYTVFEHPVLMAEYIRDRKWDEVLPACVREEIASLIETHHGQWNTSKKSSTVLLKPTSKEQFFVHLCDYLASRRNIVFRIDDIAPVFDEMIQNRADDPEEKGMGGDKEIKEEHSTANTSQELSYCPDQLQQCLYNAAGELLTQYIPDLRALHHSGDGTIGERVRRLREQMDGHLWDGRMLTNGRSVYIFMDSCIHAVPEQLIAPLTVLGQMIRA